MSILKASENDIPKLEALLNSAYRGELSKKGWTSEADLLKGKIRTDHATLLQLMRKPNSVFLKFIHGNDKIEGCVYLQKQNLKLYLGMLSVSPLIQGKGIGKQLLNAADSVAKEMHCNLIFMRVISVRKELIEWYEKLGYKRTGVFEPFETEERFGKPTQKLKFEILEKEV